MYIGTLGPSKQLDSANATTFIVVPCPKSGSSNRALDVFVIDEVLRHVLFHLRSIGPSALKLRSPKDLLACALTCQSIREAALDLLWEDIPDVGCLLRIWCASGLLDVSTSSCWKFARQIDSEDWIRFDYYASRIRSVGVVSDPGSNHATRSMISSTLESVSRRASRTWPLLPKLKELTLRLDNSQGLDELSLFLSGCVTLTSVTVKGDSKTLSDWMGALERVRDMPEGARLCHLDVGAMERVAGDTGENGFAIYHLIFDLIAKHPLQSASVPSSCLAHKVLLDRLPLVDSLAGLDVKGNDDWDRPLVPITFEIAGPVTVSSNAPGLLRLCSSGVRWRNLTILDVENNHCILWDDLRDIFRGLNIACPALESFRMESAMGDEDDDPHTTRPDPSLSPLFSCSALKIFALNVYEVKPLPRDFNLTDKDWKRVSESWPDIEELTFGVTSKKINQTTVPSPRLIPRATLMSVEHFARNCRRIEHLEIPVGAAYVKGLYTTAIAFRGQLDALRLRSSHIRHSGKSDEELKATARFLANVTRGNDVNITFPKPVHWSCGRDRMTKRRCREWDLTVRGYYSSVMLNGLAAKGSIILDNEGELADLSPPLGPR
ncbi:hypothetical protein FRB98_005712 [Tulasnella sp. 332]|nr:hypothetical protein FRB98_005712 [Tulasnella sp. 332]